MIKRFELARYLCNWQDMYSYALFWMIISWLISYALLSIPMIFGCWVMHIWQILLVLWLFDDSCWSILVHDFVKRRPRVSLLSLLMLLWPLKLMPCLFHFFFDLSHLKWSWSRFTLVCWIDTACRIGSTALFLVYEKMTCSYRAVDHLEYLHAFCIIL